MTQRDKLQATAKELYYNRNWLRCTLVLCTGFGKSKTVIDILGEYPGIENMNIMVLVNNRTLRDKSWIEEFKKHDKYNLLPRVELHTYQAAYKFKADKKDLSNYIIVADEIDFAADTDEYSKFFYEYPEVPMIGLTGYITDNKQNWFEKHMPVLMEYTIAQAIADGVLNGMHFVFVKYKLSTDKDRKIEYTKNGQKRHFFTSESSHYDYLQKKFIKAVIAFDKVKTPWEMSRTPQNPDGDPALFKEYKSKRFVMNATASKRRMLLYSLKSSVHIVKTLLANLTSRDKAVVFTARNAQAREIVDHTYNNSNSKATNEANYQGFLDGTIKVIGVTSMITRGVNVDNLNIAFFESFNGSDTDAVQKLGRMARLSVDRVSTVYVLLPYYLKETRDEKTGMISYLVEPTQQVKWAKKMLSSTVIYSHETLDLR